MKFEQETLQKVIEARSRVSSARESQDIRALGTAEAGLRASVGNLFAIAEQYPDLKTNQTFLQLQSRISGLENAIADRREFYNESVNINNVRIEQFPDSVIAGMCNFKPAHLLHFEAGEKSRRRRQGPVQVTQRKGHPAHARLVSHSVGQLADRRCIYLPRLARLADQRAASSGPMRWA